MDLIALMCREPTTHLGVFVRGVIVQHKVDVQLGRSVLLDVFEELQELLMAMLRLALRNDLTARHIESGEQRGRAMANVVVRDSLDVSQAERQHRLGSFERLDLAFLVKDRKSTRLNSSH